ncbi:MAG: ABC transporter permease [Blastocatellia bacterium]|nr:ABC transporter permease [Blastocatellia bacterium]
MATLWQDLRYGMRTLLQKPGFTAVAVLTLALGIGANSAIFSVINSVLIQPPPYQNPDRLVMVWETLPSAGITQNTPAPAVYYSWREQNRVFEDMAAFTTTTFNLTGREQPEKLNGLRVSASFFPMLGVEPVLGRAFLAEEDQPGARKVVLISHNLWQRRLGADPDIAGKTITLNDQSVTVVGVMPRGFQFILPETDVWSPIAFTAKEAESLSHYLWVVARLKPEATYQQAQSEIDAITARFFQQADQQSSDPVAIGANVVPLREQLSGDLWPALLILFSAAGFVLLIACSNVANLMLARAASRQKEIAVRLALGAGRSRLIRQLLTESLLLAGAGGAAGLALAFWGVDLLVSLMPDRIAQLETAHVDLNVLGFAMVLSLLTGVVFGLVPALQATRPDLNQVLKQGGRDTSSGGRTPVRSLLVVAEIGLALVLLIGAGLLMRSFVRLNNIDPGFNPENVLTMQVVLPESKYPEHHHRTAFYDNLLQRVRSLPGVEAAGLINGLPLSYTGGGGGFFIEGRPESDSSLLATYRIISPDYFRAMRIPLLKGRVFDAQDTVDTIDAAVISEAMAQRAWPDDDPIGKRLKWGTDGKLMTVIGVVKDVRLALRLEARPQVYMPYSQVSIYPPSDLVVRTRTGPLSLAAAVRNEVWAIDKDQPVADISTMERVLSDSLARQRFNLLLLGVFAALALVIATVGIYGVMSYLVAQSTREIGIRQALGAEPLDVVKLVLGKGLALSLIGVVIGVAAALSLTRLMSSLLFGISATDPLTFVIVALLLIVVAAAACLIPARRAMKVDPMVALRYE